MLIRVGDLQKIPVRLFVFQKLMKLDDIAIGNKKYWGQLRTVKSLRSGTTCLSLLESS